jgi:hypothetical protein
MNAVIVCRIRCKAENDCCVRQNGCGIESSLRSVALRCSVLKTRSGEFVRSPDDRGFAQAK